MAEGEEELFTHVEYQPTLGGFLSPGLPSESAKSLSELTDGRFALRGGAVINRDTGRIIGNLSTVRGASMEIGTRGTIILNNHVDKSGLGRAQGTQAIPRAIIQGDLSVLGPGVPEQVNRTITLAPKGAVIYVDDSKPTGRGRYTRIDTGVFGAPGPPSSNEFGRLATADDLLVRGVAGWASRALPGVIDRLKLTGVTMPDGTQSVSGSDIIRVIAANINVQPVISYVLGTAPI